MIYSFMYAFFYQLSERLRSNDSKFYSSAFVILTIFFHAFFLVVILEFLTHFSLNSIFGYPSNKYVFLPLVLFFMWILERIFKRNADRIIKRYEGRTLLTIPRGLLILCIVFIPLILTIILSKK